MPVYREVQYIRRHWLVLTLVGISVGGLFLIIRHRQMNQSLGAFFDMTMGVSVLLTVLLAVWFMKARLVTEVRQDGLFVHYEWLWKPKEISYAEIASVEAFTYRPIRDYGGWGIRRGKGEYMWNAYGDRAVRLHFKSGVAFSLGSETPEKLVGAIEPFLN